MAAVAMILVLLCPEASAGAPHERLGSSFADPRLGGPAVADGHVVWTVSPGATVRAAAPGAKTRVLARFAGPARTPGLAYDNAAVVLAGGPRPVVLREVRAFDPLAYRGSGGMGFAGWEVHAGDPLRPVAGAVFEGPPVGRACDAPLAGADGDRVVLAHFGRPQGDGPCRSVRDLDVLDARTGAARPLRAQTSVSIPRLAGRYAAFVDQNLLGQARRAIVVLDLVSGRELYRTVPQNLTAPPELDVQADGKVVAVLGGRSPRRGRAVAWFGPADPRGRRLAVRSAGGAVRIAGDRVLVTRVRALRGELAVVGLRGGLRRIRAAVGDATDFDGRWAAWSGASGRRTGIFRTRVARP